MPTASNIWLPSSLLFDSHLIHTLRAENSLKLRYKKETHLQRILEKRNGPAQRLLYSYLELRTGGLPPYPPVLSKTAIKCLLSHCDVEDIYLETGAEGNLSDFASNICAAPPDEFIALLESLASMPFDVTSPRARRVTLRAMEILMYRDYSWSRKRQLMSGPDSLLEPFSTQLLFKKNVRLYARYHKHISSLLNPDSARYRSLIIDVLKHAINIGLNPIEALASADELIDHHRIAQFLSMLPKRKRMSRPVPTKNAASRITNGPRGRKRKLEAESNNSLQAASKKKKTKLDSPAQVDIAARVRPQVITPSQQQKAKPVVASQIKVLATIEPTPDDTSHKSYPTKDRNDLDASMDEKRRRKIEKRLRKEEKRLKKEERRRYKEEKRQRKEERRRRKEEKRQQMLTRPSTQKTTRGTKRNPQKLNDSPRKDSHQDSMVREAPRSSTNSSPLSFIPKLFDDGPSQQLWAESQGQLSQVTASLPLTKSLANKKDISQAVNAEIDFSWSDSASDGDHLAPMQSTLTCTARKKRKQSQTTSHYFSPPSALKPKPTGVSTIPVPHLSANCFGLIQEELADEPFALLVAVKLLNKTRGHFANRNHPLSALNTFARLMDDYPTPESLADAKVEDVTATIRHLGLQNQRAKTLIAMAQTWVRDPPQKGVRYPTPRYPTHIQGEGKQMIGANLKSTYIDDESVDPRIGAFEIAHLPGIGPYALDSWRIFCRDVLRGLATSYNGEGWIGSRSRSSKGGFEPEWKRVRPADKELRAFLKWMWLKEGWIWDPETGERYRASKDVMEDADGRKAWVEVNQR
jgi:endonuclease III